MAVNSILEDVKKMCNIAADDDSFDRDVIIHINAAFATLRQLGVGPAHGFMIEDETATWDDFIGDTPRFNHAKPYIYLRVRVIFDPPQTSYQIAAMKEQIAEFEWRLNTEREMTDWVNPFGVVPAQLPVVLDGGTP